MHKSLDFRSLNQQNYDLSLYHNFETRYILLYFVILLYSAVLKYLRKVVFNLPTMSCD